jgi:hypothetical protein
LVRLQQALDTLQTPGASGRTPRLLVGEMDGKTVVVLSDTR